MHTSSLIKPCLAVFLLLSQLPGQSDAQKNNGQEENEFKVIERYPLISIDAEVISLSTGSAITSLRHEDFIISENNVQQVVQFWQQLPVPLSLLIVVDTAANSAGGVSVADRVAALESSLALFLRPEDEASIMALTEGPLLLQDYTSNKDLITRGLEEALRHKDSPHLPAEKRFRIGVHEAARHTERSHNPESRRATIFISDLPERTARKVILPEWVIRAVLRSSSIFCWSRSSRLPSRLLDPSKVSFNRVTVNDVVSVTGGEYLGNDWKSFLERLRGRLRLGYLPDTFGRSGDAVRIGLQLKPNVRAGMRDLMLLYPRFAIVPFPSR
jgi:hypothetical protein